MLNKRNLHRVAKNSNIEDDYLIDPKVGWMLLIHLLEVLPCGLRGEGRVIGEDDALRE